MNYIDSRRRQGRKSHPISVGVCIALLAWGGASFAADPPSSHGGGRPAPAERNIEGELSEKLKDGLDGWIHGAAEKQGLFVFTYRDPKDFFASWEYSLVAASTETAKRLQSLDRHDRVRIKGRFIAHVSPQKHILLEEIVAVRQWDDPEGQSSYSRRINDVRKALKGKDSIVARVHAVDNGGRVLVVDYGDAVLPVFVSDPAHTKDLYRGDKIRLHFTIQERPNAPIHLNLNPEAKQPVELLQRMKDLDGKEAVLEGALILYPQSPQIRFNVFAVQQVDKDKVEWDYTLVNFTSPEAFTAVREKLQRAWDEQRKTAVRGRNKWVNPNLKVRARGKLNIQSPDQANPQILLESADAIEVIPAR